MLYCEYILVKAKRSSTLAIVEIAMEKGIP